MRSKDGHMRGEKFHRSTLVRHLLSGENIAVLYKRSDFRSGQILHQEFFLCVYACLDTETALILHQNKG